MLYSNAYAKLYCMQVLCQVYRLVLCMQHVCHCVLAWYVLQYHYETGIVIAIANAVLDSWYDSCNGNVGMWIAGGPRVIDLVKGR